MVSTLKRIYRRIRKHLSNYTKAIIPPENHRNFSLDRKLAPKRSSVDWDSLVIPHQPLKRERLLNFVGKPENKPERCRTVEKNKDALLNVMTMFSIRLVHLNKPRVML